MEGNIFNKFIVKLKNKLNTSNKENTTQNLEYAFSTEELNSLEKQNKEKIKELKKKEIRKEDPKESSKIEKENPIEIEEKLIEEKKEPNHPQNSYINLTKDKQKIIMDRWKNIDIIRLDEDIAKGKDILAHNYSITYGDDALAYIYRIRDEYDILIEYLIGFNNEKKEIYDKTIFSDKIDNEWHHLNSYIKVLEKIRSIKK